MIFVTKIWKYLDEDFYYGTNVFDGFMKFGMVVQFPNFKVRKSRDIPVTPATNLKKVTFPFKVYPQPFTLNILDHS